MKLQKLDLRVAEWIEPAVESRRMQTVLLSTVIRLKAHKWFIDTSKCEIYLAVIEFMERLAWWNVGSCWCARSGISKPSNLNCTNNFQSLSDVNWENISKEKLVIDWRRVGMLIVMTHPGRPLKLLRISCENQTARDGNLSATLPSNSMTHSSPPQTFKIVYN